MRLTYLPMYIMMTCLHRPYTCLEVEGEGPFTNFDCYEIICCVCDASL